MQTFGGSSLPAPWGSSTTSTGTVTTAYDANFTTVTDQAGKVRRSMTNGIGQLARVDEPDANGNLGSTDSPVQPTAYDYDALNNLLHVYQGSQTRSFTYSSLARLLTANNPESGKINYQYDDGGNLTQKTDARSITTTYVYDALNRATSRSYSDSTPAVTYTYDSTTITNGRGRLASVSSSVSSYSYSGYDALGRALGGTQTIGSQNYSVSNVVYDLAGHVTSMTYPSGRTVTNAFDNAGRLQTFSGTLGNTAGDSTTRTYSTGISYAAGGQMTQEQFGTTTTPIYNKLNYNSRGQLIGVLASTSGNDATFNRGKIVNDYGTTDNNGNLKQQTVYVPNDQNTSPTSRYQQYGYDSLNRLTQVHEYTGNAAFDWQQAYAFDRYGNRTIDGVNTTDGIRKPNFTVNAATNQLGVPSGQSGTMSYDSVGNLTTDAYSAAAVTRAYDAENRMTKETQANSYIAGTYSYDGDGHRVKRSIAVAGQPSPVETWQVYGLRGELIAEYPQNGLASSPQKEYGYRNGQLLVTATPVSGTPPTFTDNPLATGSTTIKAVHLTELRDAVNQARSRAGLSAANWTDSSLSGVAIKAVHITELRTRLDEAREALGLSAASYTDANLSGVAVKVVHITELRARVAETVTSTDIRWMVTDQLGTPRMIFDQSSSLANVSRHDYLPFGEELFAGTGGRTTAQGYSASDGVRQRFTGQQRDVETNLDYFIHRYYSNLQGRFTSADVTFADQSEANPQSWNLYTYVGNSPLSFTDPLGLWKEVECTGGGRCFEAEKNDSLSTLAKQYRLNYKDLIKQFGNGGVEVGQTLLVLNPGSIPTSRDEGPAVVRVFLVQAEREREEFQRAATEFIHKYLNPCPNPHVRCGVFFHGGMGALEGLEGEITITESGLQHVFARHAAGGASTAGKSIFNAGEDIVGLIRQSENVQAVQQAGGNFQRVVDAGRIIGVDRATGQPTSIYTVITDAAGKLVTAFPGKP